MSLTNAELIFFNTLGEYLNSKNIKSFLVGGCVRDLLLKYQVKDFDVMLEADATKILAELYDFQDFSYHCSKPIIFKKYKTAKVVFSRVEKDFSIALDFSSARKEVYPEVAANPICEPGNFQQDLARRDFTINALAYSLFPLDINSPIDLFDGLTDLSEKRIRVLHDLSFRDDPARIIRAARFVSRFGFSLDSKTEELLIQARINKYPNSLPDRRIYDELRKALVEDTWKETLSYLSEREVLSLFSPELSWAWGKNTEMIFEDTWIERLEKLALCLSDLEASELNIKFGLKNAR